ncbi:MAG TPA: hypothetical protein VK419_03605 [Bryobacteraceae bacterium]|nr:hypothetical protein [Bryobacteraceae bacterium]
MSWVVTCIGCGSAMAAVVAVIASRLRPYWSAAACSPADLMDFSLARYEPMTRLLHDPDLHFLEKQPGYRPEIGQKLRRERLRIFRLYLADLAADFRALHAAAREMVANSDAQHADLIAPLFRQQFTFWRAIASIEFRLMTGGRSLIPAEVRGLIDAMEAMRLALAGMAPAPSAA